MVHCLHLIVFCSPLAGANGGLPCAPIAVQPISVSTPDGPARGYLATIDLSDPQLKVLVNAFQSSEAQQSPPSASGKNANARLTSPDAWAIETGANLVVNANYFSWLGAKKQGEPAQILGLCIRDGALVSDAREFKQTLDPALIITESREARIVGDDPLLLQGAVAAVAGIGASDTATEAGAQLVTDGKNTGAQARVEPLKRHPRTAIGVGSDKHTLYVVAIDGRQPDYSVGVTLPELADYFISLGAQDAINLDGGGSTAFVYRPCDGSPTVTNRPSDGSFRPVAVCLGFKVEAASEPAPAVSDQAPKEVPSRR